MNYPTLAQPTSYPEGEQRFILRRVSWQQYKALEKDLEPIFGVKLAYFHGTLEFITVSEEHEDIKSLIGTLVELYLLEIRIRYYRRGAPTLKKEAEVELMPDESFNIGSKKAFPDLAIEVIVTSGNTGKLAGYKTLNVPEVWFWRNESLSIYVLKDDAYEQAIQSELFPDLDLELFTRCVNMSDQFDAVNEFRQGIR